MGQKFFFQADLSTFRAPTRDDLDFSAILGRKSIFWVGNRTKTAENPKNRELEPEKCSDRLEKKISTHRKSRFFEVEKFFSTSKNRLFRWVEIFFQTILSTFRAPTRDFFGFFSYFGPEIDMLGRKSTKNSSKIKKKSRVGARKVLKMV